MKPMHMSSVCLRRLTSFRSEPLCGGPSHMRLNMNINETIPVRISIQIEPLIEKRMLLGLCELSNIILETSHIIIGSLTNEFTLWSVMIKLCDEPSIVFDWFWIWVINGGWMNSLPSLQQNFQSKRQFAEINRRVDFSMTVFSKFCERRIENVILNIYFMEHVCNENNSTCRWRKSNSWTCLVSLFCINFIHDFTMKFGNQ